MDPMLELARHPDIVEAIERIDDQDEVGAAAHDLLLTEELAGSYPNAWLTEVVHAFYAQPRLASAAWVQLRYCKQFVTDVARRSLRELEIWPKPWGPQNPVRSLIPKDIATEWNHDRTAAEERWTA